METSLFLVLFVAYFLPTISRVGIRKQKERRMAEHRMNARLLRLTFNVFDALRTKAWSI